MARIQYKSSISFKWILLCFTALSEKKSRSNCSPGWLMPFQYRWLRQLWAQHLPQLRRDMAELAHIRDAGGNPEPGVLYVRLNSNTAWSFCLSFFWRVSRQQRASSAGGELQMAAAQQTGSQCHTNTWKRNCTALISNPDDEEQLVAHRQPWSLLNTLLLDMTRVAELIQRQNHIGGEGGWGGGVSFPY